MIPGFEDFNRRVRSPLASSSQRRRRPSIRHATGKARFTVQPIPRIALEPGQMLMMTIRSHDQYNTTIYGLDDRYRGIYQDRRVIFMNPLDIAAMGLVGGRWSI